METDLDPMMTGGILLAVLLGFVAYCMLNIARFKETLCEHGAYLTFAWTLLAVLCVSVTQDVAWRNIEDTSALVWFAMILLATVVTRSFSYNYMVEAFDSTRVSSQPGRRVRLALVWWQKFAARVILTAVLLAVAFEFARGARGTSIILLVFVILSGSLLRVTSYAREQERALEPENPDDKEPKASHPDW